MEAKKVILLFNIFNVATHSCPSTLKMTDFLCRDGPIDTSLDASSVPGQAANMVDKRMPKRIPTQETSAESGAMTAANI